MEWGEGGNKKLLVQEKINYNYIELQVMAFYSSLYIFSLFMSNFWYNSTSVTPEGPRVHGYVVAYYNIGSQSFALSNYHRIESISVGDEMVVVSVKFIGRELRGDTHTRRGREGTNSALFNKGWPFLLIF